MHTASLLMALMLVSCSAFKKTEENKKVASIQSTNVEASIAEWPLASQSAAKAFMAKHGPPDEATASRLIWNKRGRYLRTIVYKEEFKHNFPYPHTDVIEQAIGYEFPSSKVDNLYRFNGSLTPNRTRGELVSRCATEEMNILAFNLAHRIVKGLGIEEARLQFTKSAQAMSVGDTDKLTRRIGFRNPALSADPDDVIFDPFVDRKDHIEAEEVR